MPKKYSFTLPLLLGLAVALGILLGAQFSGSTSAAAKIGSSTKFEYILSTIKNNYVDPVEEGPLVEDAVTGMLKKLDPHSVYISADELQQMNEPLEGNFEGIGIEFNLLRDTIVVVSAITGGPSEAVGLRAGDKIIAVEDQDMTGPDITNQDVIDNLRGEKGTEVEVTVRRRGVSGPLKFTITRDKIPLYSVVAHHMVDQNTGYIKITRFSAKTYDEFKQAIEPLQEQGMNNLILDLRGNPGGYLQAAIRISDEFLAKDKLIVYTEGRERPKREYKASRPGHFEQGKLVVLIDEGSASASEIVSGAVQDWDRGLLVGRRSFGKGLVQESFRLPDGAAMRLTIARYYTPSGRSIQRPYDEGADAYYQEVVDRLEEGELSSRDSVHLADSLRYTTNNGRMVYGGGGVMPDWFVPLDTAGNSSFFNALMRKGVINQFTLQYMDRHRKEMNRTYDDSRSFAKQYKVDQALVRQLAAYAQKQGVKAQMPAPGTEQMARIRHNLKSLMARQLYGQDGFFRIFNQKNSAFQRAMELIHSAKPWEALSS